MMLPPNRMDYSPIIDRPVIQLPGNARVAFWVAPNADFCVEALEEALSKGRPENFNTDQGSQFTGEAFAGLLDRLWRTVKYEEVYLRA